MKRTVTLLGGGFLAVGLTISALAHDGKHKEGEEAKPTTLIGELVDTACFVSSDGDAKGKDHAECASKCMGTGVPAGILPQNSKNADAMLFLLTNPKPLAPHAAKTIKVEGTLNAKMHAFDVKKLYVQAAGGKWQEVQLEDEHHKMGGEEAHDDGHAEHKPGAGKSGDKGGGAKHDHKK